MEKYRMDRNRRLFRAGLLAALLLSPCLWAQETPDGGTAADASPDVPAAAPQALPEKKAPLIDILLLSSPERPIVRGTWIVTVMADHPFPAEVTVRPPRIPPALVLERVRTEGRYLTRPVGAEEVTEGAPAEPARTERRRWTAVEFTFTPVEAGTVKLDPFGVSLADGRTAQTASLSTRVYEPRRSTAKQPLFAWEKIAGPLPPDEASLLTLSLSNWGADSPPPAPLLRGRGPRNAIMEEGLPSGPDDKGVFRYGFKVIPLGGGEISLGPLTVQAGGEEFAIPALSVPVAARPSGVPAGVPQAQAEAPAFSPPTEAPLPAPSLAFPEPPHHVFFLFRGAARRVYEEAEVLWDEGRRAEALALVRREERSGIAGGSLAPLRREMESGLGLTLTEDEVWQPWDTPLLPWAAAAILTIVIIAVWKFLVTSGGFKGYKSVIFLALSGILVVGLLFGGVMDYVRIVPDGGRRAVLEKTPGYRVPDFEGAVNTDFQEGQPVNVRSSQGGWIYAEALDGRAGWVPSQAAHIF